MQVISEENKVEEQLDVALSEEKTEKDIEPTDAVLSEENNEKL